MKAALEGIGASRRRLLWLLSGIGVFLCWFSPSSHAQENAAPPRPLTLGVVPQMDVRRTFETWQPLLAALEKKIGIALVLSPTTSIAEHSKRLHLGTTDLVYTNPYFAMHAIRHCDYVPLVRDTGEMLQGIIIVHKDSPIKVFEDLRDQTIAFPNQYAYAAFLLIRQNLADERINISPIFVGNHQSVMLNVAVRQVSAGGIASSMFYIAPQELRENLRIIYRTPTVAPHPIMAHTRIPSAMRTRIQQALLVLAATPEGQALFSQIPMKKPGVADADDYANVPEMGIVLPDPNSPPR